MLRMRAKVGSAQCGKSDPCFINAEPMSTSHERAISKDVVKGLGMEENAKWEK